MFFWRDNAASRNFRNEERTYLGLDDFRAFGELGRGREAIGCVGSSVRGRKGVRGDERRSGSDDQRGSSRED